MNRLRTLAGISVFWIGLSVIGDAFVTVVVVALVAGAAPQQLTATAVGLITFAGIGAGMAVQPVAGALSDALRPSWGRRGQLLVGAVLVALALAVFGRASGLAAIAIAFVFVQIALAIAQAAQQGLIPDIVERSWRGRAAGVKGFADLTGAFVGFSLVAVLSGPEVGRAILVLGAVVLGTAVAAAVLVREPRVDRRRDGATSVAATLRRSFRLDVPQRTTFVRVIIARFLFLLGTYTVGRYLLLIVAERLRLDAASAESAAATLFAVLTLITALASIPAGWVADRRGRAGVMVAGALAGVAGAVAFLAAPDMPAALMAGGLLAIGSAAFATASWAWTTDLVGGAAAGRHMGIANIGTAGAAAAAGLFGPVVDVSRAIVPGLGFGAALVPAMVLFSLAALVARSASAPAPMYANAGPSKPAFRPASLPHPEVPEP